MRCFIFEYEDVETLESVVGWMMAESEEMARMYLKPHAVVSISEVPPEVARSNTLEAA